ncbi:pectinesterase family protein [Bacillus altitudinis]|uniref:pectinesterase family protein n=1 Tax=Bacillus TaxID=1386 RepID=UPI00148EC0FC|nr:MULTISPECIES: pectinesterase family protein [Bacillus]MBW3702250.1 pectin esterase [Bacillus aerophilus]MCA0119096.1 pectin esterase [Bacillus sp. RSS_NA_20]MCM3227752.1 pectinesterase family protein [Bacillus altitudinis]NOL32884.1 pectin esterase [Bacillus altitudinis]
MKYGKRLLMMVLALLLFDSAYAQAAGHNHQTNRVLIVDQKGNGTFRTVQSAIDAIPVNNQQQTTIYIKNGVYKEKILLPQNKPYVSFIGENQYQTILTYDDTNASSGSTTNSSSTMIRANHFYAENITFQNTAGRNAGQAVALYVSGDRAVFKHVRVLGYQDTLYATGTGRQYYEDCYIEGTVDFIFGSATAVFKRAEIKSLGNGYITAASTTEAQKYGYVFIDSTLNKGTAASQSVYLGRPWRPHSAVTFLQTKMDEHIKAEGWHNWDNKDNERTARYQEYGSTGAGSHLANRVKWSTILTKNEASQITVQSVLSGSDGWNPENR